MATLPDHIRTTIAQRQRQRKLCAQAVELLLSEPRIAITAEHLVQKGMTLLKEDQCDLNGTAGIREASSLEKEAWEALERVIPHTSTISNYEALRAREHIETIKRLVDLQATLIELAIPISPKAAPLQVLWEQYQHRHGQDTSLCKEELPAQRRNQHDNQ
jgi:hypothetical protein